MEGKIAEVIASSDQAAEPKPAPQVSGDVEVTSSPPSSVGENSTAPATGQGKWPQHLISRGAQDKPTTVQLQDADHARFVNRVARAFQSVGDKGGEIRLRLSPPELGSLRLDIKVQAGTLSAHIEADTPLARSVLLDNLPVLRQRLAEQNIRVDQFDVDLTDRQSGGAADNAADDGDRPSQRTREGAATHDTDEPATDQTATLPQQETNGRLNVVV